MYTITVEDHDTKIIAVHTFETTDADAIHNFVDIFCNLFNNDYLIGDNEDIDDYISNCIYEDDDCLDEYEDEWQNLAGTLSLFFYFTLSFFN